MKLEVDQLRLTYQVNNSDDEFVSHIMFPIIGGFIKEKEPYYLTMPAQWTDRRIDPFKKLGDGNHQFWARANNRLDIRYPQFLITSWMDYGNELGGISIEQRSPAFDICDFGVERKIAKANDRKENNSEALVLALQSYPNVEKGKSETSCEYVVNVHCADWQEAASRHREWLRQYYKHPAIPQNFKASLGWHFFFMKEQDGTVFRTYDDLPAMAKAAVEAGIKNILVFGWFTAGADNYFPFGYYANEDWGGAENLKEKLDECRKLGCKVIPYFNGTLLDISTKEYAEYGYRWPVLGRTGSPYCGAEFSRANNDLGFRNAMISTTTRNNTLLDVCITGKEVSAWWKETVRRIVVQYGFGNIHLDQIAHKSYVCYDKSHGHEKPQWAYTKEHEGLLASIRSIVTQNNPDGVIIGEGLSDITAQYCDGIWNWHQLNDPEIVRYSVPWINYSHETDANEYSVVNACFAEKIFLDLKINGGVGILSDYPSFTRHLRKLSALKKKLLDTYVNGEYRYIEGLKYEEDSDIRIRIYKNENSGRAVVVISNLTERKHKASLNCKYSDKDAVLSRLDGSSTNIRLAGKFEVELGAYEVAALEFRTGKIIDYG